MCGSFFLSEWVLTVVWPIGSDFCVSHNFFPATLPPASTHSVYFCPLRFESSFSALDLSTQLFWVFCWLALWSGSLSSWGLCLPFFLSPLPNFLSYRCFSIYFQLINKVFVKIIMGISIMKNSMACKLKNKQTSKQTEFALHSLLIIWGWRDRKLFWFESRSCSENSSVAVIKVKSHWNFGENV